VAYPVQEDRFSLIEATSALGRPAVVKMRERGKGPHLGRSQLVKIHSEAFFLDDGKEPVLAGSEHSPCKARRDQGK
jgi:hypothetical protein